MMMLMQTFTHHHVQPHMYRNVNTLSPFMLFMDFHTHIFADTFKIVESDRSTVTSDNSSVT